MRVLAGGQGLRGVKSALVSPGDGVEAKIVQHFRPVRNLDKAQRQELMRRFSAARRARLAEARGEAPPSAPAPADEAVKLPPHPYFQDLENLSLRELDHVRAVFINVSKRQPNAQIAETVLIEVTAEPDAAPGKRQIRLLTPQGFTNPMEFRVGVLPEAREFEPNEPGPKTDAPPAPPLQLPVTINGQILPGDADRFEFVAAKGQRLAMRTEARGLVPYLADAVPGWFQAVLTVYDASGREVAFADDYRFDPDPVLFFEAPQDGTYTVEIRDSIYRGREDFVYRISVGELPFVTGVWPLGGPAGGETTASISGWNLPSGRLALDMAPGPDRVREMALEDGLTPSNPVLYAVDTLPECEEAEPNDGETAQAVSLPCIVNGRIGRGGDVDVFEFEAGAGVELVADVMARRLNSPLDSMLRVTDAAGKVVVWNDDFERRECGLMTHYADSYVRAALPQAGVYRVALGDVRQAGGPEFAYRLRLSGPRPDFELRATPSSLGLPAGGTLPMKVFAIRKDGFDGEIELTLKEPARGFRISGGRVPAGRDEVTITLTAPRALKGPVALDFEGRARIGGEFVTRRAVPADDVMQAFVYRHLVPARDFVAAVARRQPMPPMRLTGTLPLRIAPGERETVTVNTPANPRLEDVELRLNEPAAGLTLGEVSVVSAGLAFEIAAGAEAKPGLADNLIVDIYMKPGKAPEKNAKKDQKPVFVGTLPAIAFEIE